MHQQRLELHIPAFSFPAKAARMTIAHQEQPSPREHCDGIGRYLPAVTKITAASNSVRERRPAHVANASA
jgi:hypothetical protein